MSSKHIHTRYTAKQLGYTVEIVVFRPSVDISSYASIYDFFESNIVRCTTIDQIDSALTYRGNNDPRELLLIHNKVIQAGSRSPEEIVQIQDKLRAIYE